LQEIDWEKRSVIVGITEETHTRIKNPAFADYAALYLQIYAGFMAQVKATGIDIDPDGYQGETEELLARLRVKGATFGNGGRSLYANAISPSCVACRKGIGSATFFISLKCHRDCYYCFNPNQVEYDYFTTHKRDLVAELRELESSGKRVKHVALTGGEPLLHKDEAIAFFAQATAAFPRAYKRLYTCGDHADRSVLARLAEAGLEEIRFSIRMHDLEKGHRHTLDRIALAKEYIPQVMVEMPVLPGTRETMQELLVELDRLEIHSINLLEFCYPLVNAPEFNRRSFKIKRRPFQTLYNYWYAGGVPIAGSELLCLELMDFALDQKLGMGVHYCSLENKLTGQNYQQNYGQPLPKTAFLSNDDYLLKSAKVFGDDIPKAVRRLRKNGYREFKRNRRHHFLEFHVDQVPRLAGLDLEVGLSTSTLEARPDGQVMRELKVDLTYPEAFDPGQDL
jgi:pyruvate formate-lyase activating enzyme-like uncharacterized protein